MLDKNLVKVRFKKNLKTYEKSASVQAQMAGILSLKISECCGKNFNKIFEFGAGTGGLTKRLIKNIDFEQYLANDIMEESKEYVKKILHNANFITGDIEKVQIDEKFDLVVSNAVMQWIPDIEELLPKLRKLISDEGYFAFTTFGELNYAEIKETTGLSLHYLKSERLKQLCEKDFEIIYYDEDIVNLYFNSPIDVLKHIKYSGTNGLKSLSWTYTKLKHFEKFYKENFSIQSKVKLTYNPVYVILKAKNS